MPCAAELGGRVISHKIVKFRLLVSWSREALIKSGFEGDGLQAVRKCPILDRGFWPRRDL